MGDSTGGFILAIIIFLPISCLGFKTAYYNGRTQGNKEMQIEAVKRNYAQFIIENDNITFKWNIND